MTKTPEAKIELSKLIKENGKHGGFDYSVEEADVPKLQLFYLFYPAASPQDILGNG